MKEIEIACPIGKEPSAEQIVAAAARSMGVSVKAVSTGLRHTGRERRRMSTGCRNIRMSGTLNLSLSSVRVRQECLPPCIC